MTDAARRRVRVVVVDRYPPTDATNGAALIAGQVLPRLAHHEVTLVCPVVARHATAVEREVRLLGIEVHVVPVRRPVDAIRGWYAGRAAGRGLRLPGPFDTADARRIIDAIRTVVQDRRPDVLHTRMLTMAAFTETIRGPHGRLLELIDAGTLGMADERPRTLGDLARNRLYLRMERHGVQDQDLVTAVTEDDAATVRRLAPTVRVEAVPNGVDGERFAPRAATPNPDTIVVTGAMSYPPNADAARWLCTEVLPRVRARRPQVRVRVVGRDPGPAIVALGTLEGVTVTGFVDDLGAELAGAAVVACPMVSGTGIKNKLLEALAMARPVVSTTLGARGIAVTDGIHLRLADDPDRFADALVELLADPPAAAALGAAGRELVEAHYTWDGVARRYEELWRDLAVVADGRRTPDGRPR